MAMPRWSQVAAYVASKLAAAGLVFFGFLVIVGGFELYQMSELTRQFPLWVYIYGYAVLFSVVVDAVLYKCKAGPSKMVLTVLLYMLGGYIPFLVWFPPDQWILSLFAGGYGLACALTFLAATHLFRGWWPYSAAAAMLLLAGVVYVSMADFTVTKQWTETRTTDDYRAEFAYFNGQKEIPVELGMGQTLSYHIDWQVTNGGYGTYLDTEGGTYTNVMLGDVAWIAYRAKTPSTIRIVVTGDRAQGALTIEWEITG